MARRKSRYSGIGGQAVLEGVMMKNKENYYPFFEIDDNRIFLVPIRDKYHRLLFQESEKKFQLSLEDFQGKQGQFCDFARFCTAA